MLYIAEYCKNMIWWCCGLKIVYTRRNTLLRIYQAVTGFVPNHSPSIKGPLLEREIPKAFFQQRGPTTTAKPVMKRTDLLFYQEHRFAHVAGIKTCLRTRSQEET